MKVCYIDINNGQLRGFSYTYTDVANKLVIPSSKITKNGIVNKADDDIVYLDKMYYTNVKYSKDTLIEYLKDETITRLYAISMEAKGKLKELLDDNIVDEDITGRFTGIDVDFINGMINEISKMSNGVNIEIDYTSYYKSKITINQLVDTRQLFFFSDMPVGVYYSYNNKENNTKKKGLDDDRIDIQRTKVVLGKKSSTNVYSVYKINPMREIDDLYKQFRESNNGIDYYTIMLMDRVTSSRNIHYTKNNELKYHTSPRRLESPADEVLISEILPAGISYYAFEIFRELHKTIDKFISNDELTVNSSVDITNLIYDDKYDIKYITDFQLDYEYTIGDNKYKLPINTGLDLPTRNKLKAIAKSKPRVILLIDNISNVYCKYSTLIEVSGEYMLTANIPGNIMLLNEK